MIGFVNSKIFLFKVRRPPFCFLVSKMAGVRTGPVLENSSQEADLSAGRQLLSYELFQHNAHFITRKSASTSSVIFFF
jgi:hypothetical protein